MWFEEAPRYTQKQVPTRDTPCNVAPSSDVTHPVCHERTESTAKLYGTHKPAVPVSVLMTRTPQRQLRGLCFHRSYMSRERTAMAGRLHVVFVGAC